MTEDVKAMVHGTSAVTAVVAAVLSPIPLVDELVLMPVYGAMATRIGRLHGLSPGAMPWRPIFSTTLNGLVARALANLTVSYIPGVAAAANAASAVLLTEFLGRYIDDVCADPAAARPVGVRTIVDRIRRRNGVPHAS
jgi:uncharacterized protein (DUF697 family)